MATINLNCPQCGQIDSVRKVSSIVNAGTSSSRYSGYGDSIGHSAHGAIVMDEYITINGISQTQLSLMLSPPIQPKAIFVDGFAVMSVLLGITGIILLLFGLPIIFTSQFGFGIFLLLFSFICIGITIWMTVRNPTITTNETIRFDKQLLEWKKAINRWNELYYCHRCDGVFISNLNFIVPTQYMMEFLYYK